MPLVSVGVFYPGFMEGSYFTPRRFAEYVIRTKPVAPKVPGTIFVNTNDNNIYYVDQFGVARIVDNTLVGATALATGLLGVHSIGTPPQQEFAWVDNTGKGRYWHGDTAHVDSHSDVAHGDTITHSDSHSDVAHSDVSHHDSHSDTAHSDVAHVDNHTDVAHSDTHSDQADGHIDRHFDSAHNDSHSDTAHTDVAHVDNHSDSAHSDSHTDSHSDGTPHSDSAHSDTHSDGAHYDQPVKIGGQGT